MAADNSAAGKSGKAKLDIVAPVRTTPANDKFKGLSPKELLALGQSLRKEKKYSESLEALLVIFNKSGVSPVLKGRSSYLLGVQYYFAQGTKRDLEKARTYFSDPNTIGNKWSQYYLGVLFSNKDYPGRDLVRARAHLAKAEKLGVKQASKQLEKIGKT